MKSEATVPKTSLECESYVKSCLFDSLDPIFHRYILKKLKIMLEKRFRILFLKRLTGKNHKKRTFKIIRQIAMASFP